jgi:hypothetical protein
VWPLEKDTFFVYSKEGHGELWKINTQDILTKGCDLWRMHAQPGPKQGCVLRRGLYMLGARRSLISGKKQLRLISFLEKSSSRTPPTYEGALFSKKPTKHIRPESAFLWTLSGQVSPWEWGVGDEV